MDGSQWILRIRNSLGEQLDEDDEISANITGVPKPLVNSKPEVYTPQLIALGPYHHNREELHRMERYKLSAAKKIQTWLLDIGFEYIVHVFCKVEYQIRAHYERYIPLNSETLAWVMAIDASFLLEFLLNFSVVDQNLQRVPVGSTPLVSSVRRSSIHDMLVRDIVMLENQVPIFLLLKILELQVKPPQLAEKTLALKLSALLKELTPFKAATDFQCVEITSHSHLLEILYHSITPLCHEEPLESEEATDRNDSSIRYFLARTKTFFLARTQAFTSFLGKLIVKLPWVVITSIPTFAILKLPTESLFDSQHNSNNGQDCTQITNQGLSFDEIAIPSVTELANVGFQFIPTHGDIQSVAFDNKSMTLHLPEISLDVNTEVVLRNLIAYEASIVNGPLALTRYVELMNGIIDTEEDAKMLREKGVLVNQLRSDKEVAELWNGMSRSLRLTRVRVLDEVIEEVNKCYNAMWKVKFGGFMRRYLKRSWESLVVVIVALFFIAIGLHISSTIFGILFGTYDHRRG